ncbi:MAG: hypothetical protein Q9166_002727 [cf. Caloplaca sp. 2 TL-2023]
MEISHNIVVGIDFGTTYTAAAWADSSNPHLVEIIRNWPSGGQAVSSQVPSEIAYDHNDRTRFSWGYKISPLSHKIKWFKLGLEVDQEAIALPLGLSPADVICDYLSAIYKHVLATLHRRIDQSIMQRANVIFALTVPAIWSDSARKKTQEAAIRAGMGKESPPQIFSEPECAAIYTLKDLGAISSLRINDRMLVCDAGGGTVDIITYEVVQTDPLGIVECTAGTGDYCGSTYIDREFESLVTGRMASHYAGLLPAHKQQVIKNFETTKVAFRNEPEQEMFFVNIPTVGDIENAGVFSGNLHISREEMCKLFNPIIKRTIDLVSTQVKAVSPVNVILLVGGFGESEHLYQRIVAWANEFQIRVLQPREASTAIVRGAVIKALEATGSPKTEISRRARRWYGVTVNASFVEGRHLAEDRMLNIDTGQVLAMNQIRWFIKKGQLLPDEQTFSTFPATNLFALNDLMISGYGFHRDFRQLSLWKDNLVCCTSEVPPTRLEVPVTKLCSITSDLTHLKKNRFGRHWRGFRSYYTAHYTLCLGVQNNNLTFKLEFRGQQYGFAKVDFD